MACQCAKCRQREFESFEFERSPQNEPEAAFNEADEIELALELLTVSGEDELDQFLGKLLKRAWKGISKAGAAVGKIARPLGGALKGLAKKALPFVGGALGSLIPVPGVGTAVGTALGTAVSKALEAEVSGLELEEQELEMARRFVRVAGTAAQRAALSPASSHPESTIRSAIAEAARVHLPRFADQDRQTRWVRRGDRIIILGA